ncbi:sigma-70 family RNA polymerase sigma factor [Cohnella panacarvi]|uniref:sigma-70 family RNA polymerase sigma factor n=1 Tax=Cohnella panacarvi TaxID=400776 RepID=UPI00047D0B0D|nr:sigma-70 family RNA polymerase sigma factor [Cohnella panacarvi]
MNELIEMIIRARQGSKDDFVRMIRLYEKTMYRIAFGMLRSDEDAADAIQETIMAAFRQIHQLQEPRYAQTWLVRILINHCNGMLKRRSQVIPLYDNDAVTGSSTEHPSDDRLDLYHAIGLLGPDQREAIILHYLEDMPLKEIGELLQLSEGTIKSRLYRARERLALFMKEPAQEEGML